MGRRATTVLSSADRRRIVSLASQPGCIRGRVRLVIPPLVDPTSLDVVPAGQR